MFLDFVTRLLWGCPWSCLWSWPLSLPPDVFQRLSPMLFPRLSLRSPEVAWGRLRLPSRLPPRFASQVDFKVTSDVALPGCLASLPRQDVPDVAPEFAPKFSSRCCLQDGPDVTMYWGCPQSCPPGWILVCHRCYTCGCSRGWALASLQMAIWKQLTSYRGNYPFLRLIYVDIFI